MADFQFSCPLCRQMIVCDSSCAGSPIQCPLCRQTIVVPPTTPAVPPAAARACRSTRAVLGIAALAGAGILVVAGVAALVVHLLAGPKKLTFRAYVDGVDIVNFSGKDLWIEHLDFQPPTRITINRKRWDPVWTGRTSDACRLAPPFLPRKAGRVKLLDCTGRGEISIVEPPGTANGQTLAIKIDDGVQGGADWYQFTVAW